MSRAAAQPITGRPARPSLLPEHPEPTWDLEAERATLGGALLITDVLEQLSGFLQPSDFFLASHQRIFAAMLALREEGAPVDPITVAGRLSADDEVISQGGSNYIWTLPQLAVPALHAPHHARIVKDLAQRRRAQEICLAVLDGRLNPGEAHRALAELDDVRCTDSLPVIDARTFCRKTPEEPDWIFEGYVARGAITELDAKIKTGKTHFATDLIRAVLSDEEFLGRKTTRTGVLYLTEERPTSFRRALRRVGLEEEADLYLTFRHDARGNWPEIGRAIIARAKALGVGLVVVDTLSVWSGIEPDMENDAGAAMEAMRPAEAMAAAGLGVLVLRHERKSGGEVGESARGSSAFGGAADILLSLRKDHTLGHENRRLLEAVGRLEGWAPKLVLEMSGGHYQSLGTSAQVEHEKARATLVELLPDDRDNAVSEKELLAQAPDKTSRSTLKRALVELVGEGVAHKEKGAGSASTKAYGFWKTGGES